LTDFCLIHEGDEITMIEELAESGNPHPMQVSLLQQGGYQGESCIVGERNFWHLGLEKILIDVEAFTENFRADSSHLTAYCSSSLSRLS
jgi:aerobic-type carbon monoxide dehydrogenase small subunit (CoxS/CutS family)